MLRIIVLCLLAMPAVAQATPAGLPGPLTDAQKAAFAQIEADPPPPEIVRNSHYWISNEYRHDLFKDRIADLGGVHIGVGTDQNYLLAGWSKPEMLILMDFDTYIPRIHRAYGIAFEKSATPEAFLAFWQADNAEAVMARLATDFGADKDGDVGKEGKRIVRSFKTARPLIQKRLKRTLRKYKKRGVSTFLDDAEQYAYIKTLWATGRVIAIRGDLTATKTMQTIAKAAIDAGMVVRTVYMSNAPQYFNFEAQFRANIAALPFDDKSVFLHTLTRGAFGYADGYYHYNVQPGLNFQVWMETSRYRKLTQILRHRTTVKGIDGFSIMQTVPQDLPEKVRARVLKKTPPQKTPPQKTPPQKAPPQKAPPPPKK
ncbi:MAG: hypothetical protein ACI9U2_001953 [Bradymonadia bacterium]|jgi:hypothetical protein